MWNQVFRQLGLVEGLNLLLAHNMCTAALLHVVGQFKKHKSVTIITVRLWLVYVPTFTASVIMSLMYATDVIENNKCNHNLQNCSIHSSVLCNWSNIEVQVTLFFYRVVKYKRSVNSAFWKLTDTQRYRLTLIHLFVPLDRDQSYFPVLWQVEASKENAPNLNRNVWKITISVAFCYF